MAVLLYQGHGSFRLTTNAGKTIYIDPFAGKGYDIPADLILVTHQHYDHTAIDKMPHADDLVLYQNMDALQNGVYQKAEFFGVQIEATEAYNRNHPKAECVGYLIKADGKLLYFAGDTSRTEQMERLAALNIDYAFLPTDGIFNMNAEEASACAKLIRAKHVSPVHTWPDHLFSEKVAAKFDAPGKLVFRPGDILKWD